MRMFKKEIKLLIGTPAFKLKSSDILFVSDHTFNKNTPIIQQEVKSDDYVSTWKYVYIPPEYSISVSSDGNGVAYASATTAIKGTRISLSATPNEGYIFKEWNVLSGNISIVNNSFTMLQSNVLVKAIFEKINNEDNENKGEVSNNGEDQLDNIKTGDNKNNIWLFIMALVFEIMLVLSVVYKDIIKEILN